MNNPSDSMHLTPEIMYNASLEKDSSFQGIFITAVKTIGIFCRPTCTARKPKKENLEFFKTTKEAILSGYRPCKVCKPMDKPNETPASIQLILEELSNNPSLKCKDWDLIQRGLERNRRNPSGFVCSSK